MNATGDDKIVNQASLRKTNIATFPSFVVPRFSINKRNPICMYDMEVKLGNQRGLTAREGL